jgi:hypothetical protein
MRDYRAESRVANRGILAAADPEHDLRDDTMPWVLPGLYRGRRGQRRRYVHRHQQHGSGRPAPLTATPEQIADFFHLLQPYLPLGELLLNGPNACKTYATDLPSVDVRWSGGSGSGHLMFDYGCDPDEHRALAEALRDASKAPPIAKLIGKR